MYLIHPIWFYLYGLTTPLIGISFLVMAVSALIGLGFFLFSLDEYQMRDDELEKKVIKIIKKSTWTAVLTCLFFIFTPNKETLVQMAIASYATSDNVTELAKAGKIVKDEIKKDFLEIIEHFKVDAQGKEGKK